MLKKQNKRDISWNKFIEILLKIKTKSELINFLQLFLTSAEEDDIAMRYEIIRELLIGKLTQREIAKKLHISIAKISRGSNAMRITDTKIKKLLSK